MLVLELPQPLLLFFFPIVMLTKQQQNREKKENQKIITNVPYASSRVCLEQQYFHCHTLGSPRKLDKRKRRSNHHHHLSQVHAFQYDSNQCLKFMNCRIFSLLYTDTCMWLRCQLVFTVSTSLHLFHSFRIFSAFLALKIKKL